MTAGRRVGRPAVCTPEAHLGPAELAAARAAAAAAPPLTTDQLDTLSSVIGPTVRRLATPTRAA